jgi:hypothetical protein
MIQTYSTTGFGTIHHLFRARQQRRNAILGSIDGSHS